MYVKIYLNKKIAHHDQILLYSENNSVSKDLS